MKEKFSVKQGVILAAGRGARISPLSMNWPKPLLPVCNKPVMQYQIEAMRAAGIGEILVVVGQLSEKIRDFFGNGRKFGVRISYVYDDEPQGIASSLLKTERLITGPFALFLGDIFVKSLDLTSAIDRFVAEKADGIVIAKIEKDVGAVRRNFAIVVSENGRVLKVIEKPKNPPSLIKGCGLYLFNKSIFEAIKKTKRSKLRNEYEITDSIQKLIDTGGLVFCETWDLWDINLSFPEDLLKCNLRFLRELNLKSLIGRRAKINPAARLISSVVGDGAKILDPVTLEECLVFPETSVSGFSGYVRGHIFAQNLVL